jgi:quercetin 2,3-dioxygenase
MKFVIHKSGSRGFFDHGWLKTHHTFSFAQYYDPEKIHFGALRVLNDDIIDPGKGFGKHPHDNMEIITIPIEGRLLHRDSMGNEDYILPGEIQVMSAGTGIFHEEHNGDKDKYLSSLQIWIFPDSRNIKPTYAQMKFDPDNAVNQWQKLVTKDENNTLHIHQQAIISRVLLSSGTTISYELKPTSFGSYIFLVEGEIEVEGNTLLRRDGIGIYELGGVNVKASKDSYLINLEIPE